MRDKEGSIPIFDDLGKDDSSLGQQEMEEIRKTIDLFQEDPDPAPPESMDQRFYDLLDEEANKTSTGRFGNTARTFNSERFRHSLRIAAGIALFIMGWFGASWFGQGNTGSNQLADLSSEINELKQSLVLTMLDQNSPSDRIQALNMVGEMSKIDDEIIGSMLSVLNLDPNDNVKLVALETLVSYSSYPSVREGMIRSISQQKSPLIQLRLAEIMLALEEKRSVPEFRKVLSDMTIDYSVRTILNETVEVLL